MLRSGGSSPRRRGTHMWWNANNDEIRFIPAQAGNTDDWTPGDAGYSVHPRAGGEHYVHYEGDDQAAGSSPRRRGTRAEFIKIRKVDRFIPAQAGNTCSGPVGSAWTTVHPRAGGEHCCHFFHQVFDDGSSPRRRGTLFRRP
ncbi:Hypothetical protein GbCGDNIH3_7085 [Granulibacter bethesdensis]|uniref:Uncharacterized protein n=1 Tax=Granulibacter bethesdensis TaxID=364410 RepID=A0AAN0VG71_9PROT|nr:Hypothetical protein GbCGDNIH3_7085 [Granulibacter bethesdensis]